MSEPARDIQPDAHDEPKQNLDAPQGLPDLLLRKNWQKFEGSFRDMLEKLRPTKRKNVKGADLQGFLRDLEDFYNYIEDLKTGDMEYENIINNIDNLGDDLMEIIDVVLPALRVWDRYDESGWKVEQLAENDDAYYQRLSRCYLLMRSLLKEFFDKKS